MKYLALTKGKFALVDDDDYDSLSEYKWTFCGGYAYRVKKIEGKNKKIWLHRFVNKTPDGMCTDHVNGDRLDCRKQNLRTCTYAENNKNAKVRKDNAIGYRGVHWFPQLGKWRAVIQTDGKRKSIGFFDWPSDAAKAYNIAAKKYHGEFARLNIIKGAL